MFKESYKEPEAQNIQKMFSAIAPSYDKANTILSLGIHHIWKQKVVSLSGAKPGDCVLDCATGTGDLAILFKEKVGSLGQVTGTDFNADILSFAPAKAEQKELKIKFETADVTQLPYADNTFDVSSISFGIRNVKDLDRALSELARVTKPSGKVMILEFGQVRLPIFRDFYNFYSNTILPWVGGKISGNPEAYKYLNESAARFPSSQNFIDRALKTGAYKDMTCKELSFGIAYIYIGSPK
jgi:demethylmenaquinone methyltransferase / 2-methoxy-6-polyprenyl-1,4-benzoquinol methylase